MTTDSKFMSCPPCPAKSIRKELRIRLCNIPQGVAASIIYDIQDSIGGWSDIQLEYSLLGEYEDT